MKVEAIEQSKIRLARAKSAAWVIQNGLEPQVISEAWWTFLVCASAIYSKLEQGAKGCGKSQAWYGRKKQERKKDELLSYIHHARNSEIHGLDVSGVGHGIDVRAARGCEVIRDETGAWVGLNVEQGREVSVKVVPPGLVLKQVKDERYGDFFDPPLMHRGMPIQEPVAESLVGLAYEYLEKMVREAERLMDK